MGKNISGGQQKVGGQHAMCDIEYEIGICTRHYANTNINMQYATFNLQHTTQGGNTIQCTLCFAKP